MKDRNQNPLHKDDPVVFISNVATNPTIQIGFVDKIYKNNMQCTITDKHGYTHTHIFDNRVLRMDCIHL